MKEGRRTGRKKPVPKGEQLNSGMLNSMSFAQDPSYLSERANP